MFYTLKLLFGHRVFVQLALLAGVALSIDETAEARRLCRLRRRSIASQSIVFRVAAMARAKGFSARTFPMDVFDPTTLDPLVVTAEWGRVQNELETILSKYYGSLSGGEGFSEERLPLIFESIDGGAKLKAKLPEPLHPFTKTVVLQALGLPSGIFTQDARVVGAAAPSWIANLKDAYSRGDVPDFAKVKSTVEEIIRKDKTLNEAATLLHGTLSTIRVNASPRARQCIVLTEWQVFHFHADFRRYWRLRFTLDKDSESAYYNCETRVDIGERLRSQAPSQIVEVSNSYKLSEYMDPREFPEGNNDVQGKTFPRESSRASEIGLNFQQKAGPTIEMKKPYLQTVDQWSVLIKLDKAFFAAVYDVLCTRPDNDDASTSDDKLAPPAPPAPAPGA